MFKNTFCILVLLLGSVTLCGQDIGLHDHTYFNPSASRNITPRTNNTYSVGSATKQYKEVFCYDTVISSRPCAKLCYSLAGSSTTTIEIANQYELLCGTASFFSDISAWFDVVEDLNGNPNRLVYLGSRSHKFFVHLHISFVSGAATTVYLAFYVNGEIRVCSISHQALTVIANESMVVCSILTSLNTNDYLEVYVTTDDGDDISACCGQLDMFPID